MSETGADTPPFSTVDIAPQDEEDIFAAAVQGNGETPDINSIEDDLENSSISERVPASLPTSGLEEGNGKTADLNSVERDLENSSSHERVPASLLASDLEEIATERANNIAITVTEPQKIGEGMSSYVAYRVITRTNMPIFSKQELSVIRRFSDFLGLHEKLTEKYLRNGRIIPPAPDKSFMGTTKVKMTSQPSVEGVTPGTGQSEFVERRRAALERYLQRTAQHPVLCIDPDFRQFLESDTELPKATSTSALSGAGVLRLFNKVGETVNKITYKMDETDPWFEERIARIETLETCLRRLSAACETLAGERRELACRAHELSRASAALSGADPHATLSRALSGLADLHEKVENLRIEQSNADFFVLCEHVKDYVGLIAAIKDVFHERVKVFQNWQHAQIQLNKRRENRAKAELANRPEKIEQAANEILEWEAKVERGQQQFDQVSRIIKKELERWEEERTAEMKATLIRYLEERMKHAAHAIRIWEAFLPEARSIK